MRIIFFLLLSSHWSYGKVTIAYIEMRNSAGDIIQLEPNGQFAHIAILYKNKWLHSHPYRGVELISDHELDKIGKSIQVTYDFVEDLTENEFKKYLGASSDNDFSWKSTKMYCSELVGKLLKIKPLPMKFSLPIWKEIRKKAYNQLGLSPDDIYRIMQKRQQENKNQCKAVFKN